MSQANLHPSLDLSGQAFGLWRTVSFAGRVSGGKRAWVCVCTACGGEKTVREESLKAGTSKSCGCVRPSGCQWTPEQHRDSKRKWKAKQPNYRAVESKRWRDADPQRASDARRRTNYRTKYGLEIEQVEALFAAQGEKCAICAGALKLGGRSGAKVDHCHATGRVRGILCSTCNTALGSFYDSRELLANAIKYLGVAG